jgi:transcriptional regulator with XRE-family HTH domain
LEELKRLREQKGWSQARLAQESGVDRATINQVEGGRRSPTIATLEVLAEALGVEIADLFPKAQAPLFREVPEQEPPEERRSPLSAWAEYARQMADRIRLHTADAHSPAFRDSLAAMFFIEERNRDAAELWQHFEEELGREPLADEPLAAYNAALTAFEELAEALTEAQRRAEHMAEGFAESEIGQARRRAAEAAAQREQAVAQFNARRERRGA